MEDYQMKYIKSCKALLFNKKGYVIWTTEAFRENIINILKNVQIEENTNNVYDGWVNVKSYINFKYIENKQIDKWSKEVFVCPVNKDNYSKLGKSKNYPEYYTKILDGTSEEYVYLNKIEAKIFYIIDEKFVILPDNSKYPITKYDVDNRNYSNYQFVMFLKNGKYKTAFDLDINIIQEVRKNIIEFYKTLLDLKKIDENMLNILFNFDTKYNFIGINFNLFDNYRGNRYISYIEHIKTFKIEDLENIIMSGNQNKLEYYTRFQLNNKKRHIFCKNNNNLYDTFTRRQKGGNINTLFSEEDDIQIENEYYNNPEYKSPYCTEFILLKINGEYKAVSLKSMTFEVLYNEEKFNHNDKIIDKVNRKNKYDDFKYNFFNSLNDIIKSNPEYSYGNEKHYIRYLPSYVSITVKNIENYDPTLQRFFFKEKVVDYNNKTLPQIKKTMIDNTIVISLAFYNLLRINRINVSDVDKIKDVNIKKIYQTLSNHAFMKKFITHDIEYEYDGNFLITVRSSGTKDVYILWYFPKIEITNMELFLNLLEKPLFKQKGENDNNAYKNIRKNEEIMSILESCTNFYDVFREDNFIYNLRHLSDLHKKELDQLKNKFIQKKYKKEKFFQAYKNKFMCMCHYPNMNDYNVFHMYIFRYSNKEIYLKDDLLFNYVDLSYTRYFPWEKLKQIDYSKVDVKITIRNTKKHADKYLSDRFREYLALNLQRNQF
jgi:hypothetical protein